MNDARHRVGAVVMSPRGMVDGFAPAARHAPLKADQLVDELPVSEQIDRLAVQDGQQVQVQLGARKLGRLVFDPALAELLARPFVASMDPKRGAFARTASATYEGARWP